MTIKAWRASPFKGLKSRPLKQKTEGERDGVLTVAEQGERTGTDCRSSISSFKTVPLVDRGSGRKWRAQQREDSVHSQENVHNTERCKLCAFPAEPPRGSGYADKQAAHVERPGLE